MGLMLDGEPVGVQAKEAPPLQKLLALARDVGRRALDAVRELGGAETKGISAERAREGLKSIGGQRANAVDETVPAQARNSPWATRLKAPKKSGR